MDSLLIMLVIFTITAISGWLQKRAQAQQQDSWDDQKGLGRPPAPPRPPGEDQAAGQPRPSRQINWEAELRRLLQGEMPSSPAAPPPVIAQPPPAAPPPPPAASRLPSRPAPVWEEEGPARKRDAMSEVSAAYARAREVQAETKKRLEQIARQTKTHARPAQAMPIRAASDDIASVLARLRGPGSARQAIIASIILSPPKAIDPEGASPHYV